MRLVLGRFYKDNVTNSSSRATWCIVGVLHPDRGNTEPLYMGVRVSSDPVQPSAGSFYIHDDNKANSFALGAEWFTAEGIAIKPTKSTNPTVLRLVELVVPKDPNEPGAIDQLASVPPPEQKSDMPF